MLKNLLKYEFKATARTILPASLLVFLLSIVNSFLLGAFDPGDSKIVSRLVGIVTFAFVLAIMALLVIVIIALVMRFYKSNFGNEGYLTHTLPITNMQEILSKTISGIVWTLLASIVVIISISIIAFTTQDINMIDLMKAFGEFWDDCMKYVGLGHVLLFILEALLLTIVSIAATITQVYVSIGLGHMFKKAKVLMSFLAYFVINVVQVIIAVIFMNTSIPNAISDWLTTMPDLPTVHVSLWLMIGVCVVQTAIFIYGTKWVLDNKLNLE